MLTGNRLQIDVPIADGYRFWLVGWLFNIYDYKMVAIECAQIEWAKAVLGTGDY